MKRIRPDFYNEFHCIADSCTITCCQEWKIAVDPDTNRKWKKVSAPADVPEQKKNLSAYTEKKDGLRVIQLDSDHRCPFLSENRLCRLVTAYGDKILSETCTTFPREIHRFPCHIEETLMPCCPAVIDLLEQADASPPNVTLLYFRSAGTFSVFCCPHPHRSVLLRITPLSLVPPRSVPLRISCLRFIIFYRNYIVTIPWMRP